MAIEVSAPTFIGRLAETSILVVDTPLSRRRDRAIARGMTSDDWESRLAAQETRAEWLEHGDFVFDNDGDADEARIAIRKLRSLLATPMRFRLAAILFLASLGSVFLAASLPDSILAGDAANYRERMVELFSGKVPYFQFSFEHQPVMIAPLALGWIIGGSISQSWYVLATAFLSFLALLTVLFLVDRAADAIDERRLATRWLLTVSHFSRFSSSETTVGRCCSPSPPSCWR